MALSVPTLSEWIIHTNTRTVEDERYTEHLLQLATDLMAAATGLEADPPTAGYTYRLMRQGILAMAHALSIRNDMREELFSPYSSERLGSYSYQKATKDILTGEPTGVFLFDLAVNHIREEYLDDFPSNVWHSSEQVFRQFDWATVDRPPPWPQYYGPEYGTG